MIYSARSRCLEFENLSHLLALADILASLDFSTVTWTSPSEYPGLLEVLRYRQVTFLVGNIKAVFPETVSQSVSCLLDVDCPREFVARNVINDLI